MTDLPPTCDKPGNAKTSARAYLLGCGPIIIALAILYVVGRAVNSPPYSRAEYQEAARRVEAKLEQEAVPIKSIEVKRRGEGIVIVLQGAGYEEFPARKLATRSGELFFDSLPGSRGHHVRIIVKNELKLNQGILGNNTSNNLICYIMVSSRNNPPYSH